MKGFRWFRRAWRLVRRKQFTDELAEEMAFHRQQVAQAFETEGMSSASAREAAERQFGNATRLREQSHDVVQFQFETVVQDLRYALRQLRNNPGFAVAAILILALGIGSTAAIFSAVNPILFAPLPYPEAGRVVMIWDIFQGERSDVTFHTYRELAERNRSFDAVAVADRWQPTLAGQTEPERLEGEIVSAGYFRALGVSPALGRDFQVSDDQFTGPRVAILSRRLWQRRFGSNPKIVGEQITLDEDLYRVVGVMPQGFDNVLAPASEIWSPLRFDSEHITLFDTKEWGHHLRMVGRLRSGVSNELARKDLNAIAEVRVPSFPRPPWASLRYGLIVNSLQGEVTRGVKPALLAILGAVLVLLLVACVNVTNLLLARSAQRRGEFRIRAALGASQGRLLRQLLIESLLLALIGGAVGMEVAALGVRALVALGPPDLPRLDAIRLNSVVFAFSLVLTTLVGLLAGLIPGLHAWRNDPRGGLEQSSRTVAGGHRVRRTLVVVQVALALVLLVSAGLLFHSMKLLLSVDPGFDSSHLLTMQVQTSGHRLEADDARHLFFTKALEAVRQVPGVASAAFTSLLPLSGEQYGEYGTKFENEAGYDVFRYVVSPEYFQTAGIALRRGRLLNDHDLAASPQAVVISESLARRQFHDQDPIGQRVHIGPLNRPWYVIVGVVRDVKQASLAQSNPDAVYITSAQSWFADDVLSLVVRTRGDAASLTARIRKAIWSVDKDQPIVRVATMDNLLAASEAQRRFALILFEAFGILALVLAAVGIYGVLSGGVNERMRELGVRSALGATRGHILALVLRQGMALTAIGVAIGLLGAGIASRALVSLLFGISRLDAGTYLGVVVLLAGVSLIACWVPARRAARVDPSITLRAE
ncbi:MAG TPA: ABC transporter permease [Candidatus Angelobacter sp.]|nr:ABC transporter permease [Candidatus Angelobacter sp.]